MERKIIVLTLCLVLISSLVFAETIQLKSGKTIEGKIVEHTDKYIKVDIGIGMAITYFLDDVETIEGALVVTAAKPIEIKPQAEMGENTYVNEEYKVSLKAPEGWHVIIMNKRVASSTKLVKFSEYHSSSPQFRDRPQILLQVKDIPRWAKNFDEWLDRYLKLSKIGFKALAPPKEIVINGNRAVRTDSEVSFAGMSGGRTIEYLLWKNNFIYVLTLNVGDEDIGEVDRYIGIFDNCANTLSIE